MRMAATMPDLVPSKGLRSLNGAGTDAGATGGRSKCISGRQLARTGRVGASDNPWDMEQTAKSIRVRNAGDDLRPRPGSAQRWAGPPPVCRRETGMRDARIQTMRAPRARLFAQSSRTLLGGKRDREDRR